MQPRLTATPEPRPWYLAIPFNTRSYQQFSSLCEAGRELELVAQPLQRRIAVAERAMAQPLRERIAIAITAAPAKLN